MQLDSLVIDLVLGDGQPGNPRGPAVGGGTEAQTALRRAQRFRATCLG